MPLGEVNYLSVLVAAVAAWFFGALWYTVFPRRGSRRAARPWSN